MNTRPLLFLDSGIGCLPYAHFFHSRNPDERLICVADRANFPYGTKSKECLIELLTTLTEKLIDLYDPRILAVACNTASVSALAVLRERFPKLFIVGTVPAIKPAVQASQKRCVGVIGTVRTMEDFYITELANTYGPDCTIIRESATELVEFVEHCQAQADREERLGAVKPWTEKFIANGADALVLACTHFLLLKDEFEKAGAGKLKIFDSVEGICHRVESLIDSEPKTKIHRSPFGKFLPRTITNKRIFSKTEQISLKITGTSVPEPYWEKLASHFNMSLELI